MEAKDGMDHVRAAYARLAPRYDRSARRWDRLIGLDRGRRWVCQRAHGRVLEVGVGTGLSLEHYAAGVQLVAIDATPEMLELARRRSIRQGVSVDFRLAKAETLDFAEHAFDSVVFTYSLCTIPDPARALAEAHRVLRPGGSLLLTEHVRSPNPMVRSIQLLLDPLFQRLEADHLLREPLDAVTALGLVVGEIERSAFGIMERLHARKPSVEKGELA